MKSTIKALAILGPAVLITACSDGSANQATETDSAPDAIQCERPLRPRDGCEEAACEAVDCGSPTSYFDEHLCERARCERQEDCLPEEECREVHYHPPNCGYNLPDSTMCMCGLVGFPAYVFFCMPRQSP